ncbi:MAG: DNA ligase (NAD(+)) LigA, partial [Candidatus Lokiarchaeota archaeon]|nr:DNA ligase (NAD(+)) LigA [Candidatus Lokiarchaeota archaeon]
IDSTLLDVEWSVSGANYTPVAIIEPVEIMGSTVQRASLANPDIMKALRVKIGAKVMISKRGDIIPKIEYVILGAQNNYLYPNKTEISSSMEKAFTF